MPVKETERLRTDGKSWRNRTLEPGQDLLTGIEGDTFDIEAEIEPGKATDTGFRIRGETVRCAHGALSCRGHSAPLPAVGGRLKLRVLVDRASLEVYGNDGAVSMTSAFLPPSADRGVGIYAVGGPARVVSLKVWRMRSVWSRGLPEWKSRKCTGIDANEEPPSGRRAPEEPRDRDRLGSSAPAWTAGRRPDDG